MNLIYNENWQTVFPEMLTLKISALLFSMSKYKFLYYFKMSETQDEKNYYLYLHGNTHNNAL